MGDSFQKMTVVLTKALQGESLTPPPIWLMRQAGRYLPEYRQVRGEAGSFLQLCNDPARAARVTLQPIERFDFDAAIIFSDILLVPQALGQTLTFEEGEGPRLGELPARLLLDPLRWRAHLAPVYEALGLVRHHLAKNKALIGFAGAPWTLAAYMVEGRGGGFPKALELQSKDEVFFQSLIDQLIEAVSDHLLAQVKAGANWLQIFDSWSGLLPAERQDRWSVKPLAAIARKLKAEAKVPIIVFPRGASQATYEALAEVPEIDALSLGEEVDRAWAAAKLQPRKCLQGNLAPQTLVSGGAALAKEVDAILASWGKGPLVFNLGHGILQQTPPEHVAQLVSLVRKK